MNGSRPTAADYLPFDAARDLGRLSPSPNATTFPIGTLALPSPFLPASWRPAAAALKGPMAKLYFYYASMNAGKSTVLLQTDFNYRERGMQTMLFTAGIHDRSGYGIIDSRIGITATANTFEPATDLKAEIAAEGKKRKLDVVLLDESQFLTRDQVLQLADVCDEFGTPVLAYGLRTDFQGNLFEGSATLLALADKLVELKAICECGRKATMNLRVDARGYAVAAGAQTEIGGNDRYIALCRRHFRERLREGEARQLSLGLAR